MQLPVECNFSLVVHVAAHHVLEYALLLRLVHFLHCPIARQLQAKPEWRASI